MKILWISHILSYPPFGGVMQRSYNLIKEVAKENDVYLFAFNQKALLPEEKNIFKAKTEFERFCKLVKIFTLPSDRSKFIWYKLVLKSFFAKGGYTMNWTKLNKMQEEINKFLSKVSVDVIHCDTISLAEYVKNILNIPKTLNHHNIESHMMLRRAKKEENLLKKLYFYMEGIKLKKYEKKICPLFDLNFVVSDLDKEHLLSNVLSLKIEIIPNGVDTNYFIPRNGKIISHNVVFAGRMNSYPNEDAVIYFLREIWPILKREMPNASFTIAGRNPTLNIKKLIRNDSTILLTGYVDDIRLFIQQADIYVCPIRDGGGTRLKLLDAMAMSKAIVSTSIGIEGLDLINEKHVLVADDPDSFVSQLLRLYDNPDLKEYLGRNARQLVEQNFSWGIIGRKLNDAYFSLK
ncbi:MAG: glycosyltransferase family 4 protein [Candidatus Hodarchaeota archaeon]